MNGSMASGIQFKVSLARRQPVIEPINDASSSATWSTIGKDASKSLWSLFGDNTSTICLSGFSSQRPATPKKDLTKTSATW